MTRARGLPYAPQPSNLLILIFIMENISQQIKSFVERLVSSEDPKVNDLVIIGFIENFVDPTDCYKDMRYLMGLELRYKVQQYEKAIGYES